jgi:hypothetical protein
VHAAVRGAASWTVPVVVGLTFMVWLADSLAIWRTFGWFVARLRFKEVLVLRGATYLLALVNYTVGQGAIVYFVNRSRGIAVVRAAAAVLLIMGINLLLLLLLASLGLALGGESVPTLRVLLLVAYGGLAVYAVLVAWKPAFLRNRPIFDVLLAAGVSGHVKAMAVRLPHVAALLALNFLSLRAFGVSIPVVQAVLCLPVVFFIAVLPISVQGLGTTQAALTFFFARYAPGAPAVQEATVVAASLATQAMAWVVQIALGIFCLRTQLGQNLKEQPAPEAP